MSSPTITCTTYHFIGLGVGLIWRTLVPWLQKYAADNTLKFDPKYLIGPAISTLISVPAILMGLGTLTAGANHLTDFIAAFTLAYTVQDITNGVQSMAGAKKANP